MAPNTGRSSAEEARRAQAQAEAQRKAQEEAIAAEREKVRLQWHRTPDGRQRRRRDGLKLRPKPRGKHKRKPLQPRGRKSGCNGTEHRTVVSGGGETGSSSGR